MIVYCPSKPATLSCCSQTITVCTFCYLLIWRVVTNECRW